MSLLSSSSLLHLCLRRCRSRVIVVVSLSRHCCVVRRHCRIASLSLLSGCIVIVVVMSHGRRCRVVWSFCHVVWSLLLRRVVIVVVSCGRRIVVALWLVPMSPLVQLLVIDFIMRGTHLSWSQLGIDV
jgi:hypothetical protein